MPDLPPAAFPASLAETPIRLIVADIDGCLSEGSGGYFNHELLRQLALANKDSRTNAACPAVTLCTGRPQPYVECLLQVIGGYQPALCESGTVTFDPATHSILTIPQFGEREEKLLAELRCQVDKRLVRSNIKPEPGKVTHITLIVQPPDTPESLYDESVEIAAQFGDVFQVELTRMCVHFLFRHIHKGEGVNWLSKDTGIPLDQMAGIGDAAPDLPFLTRIGFACAPANAQPNVKEACHHVSAHNDSGAVLELLNMIMVHNRRLQRNGLLETCEADPN